jgi:acyl-CoA dehydrogenase
MNFEFSEEQRELQSEIRRQLAQFCPLDRCMKVMNGDPAERSNIWSSLVALGYPATAIEEHYQGAGFGYLELCLLAHELGRQLVPSPMMSTIYLGVEAVKLFGSPEQKTQYLPELASGDRVLSFAWAERPDGAAVILRNGKLYGEKLPVADYDLATSFLVYVNSDDGGKLILIPRDAEGLTITPVSVFDGSWPHAILHFDSVAGIELGGGAVDLQLIMDRAAILLAYEQIGATEAALELAVSYAKERNAFGRPIASYQAIKHKLANIFALKELALSHAYYGAWALQVNDRSLPRAAAGARLSATRAFEQASAELIQVYGGMGYTWESFCQLFYKRSRMQALALGSEMHWQARLVDGIKLEKCEEVA